MNQLPGVVDLVKDPSPPTVTLVIPGRNCEATLDRCLQSVVPLLDVVDLVKDPSAEGPSAEGPSAEGPSAEGPSAEGPSAEGPSAEGSLTRSTTNHTGSPRPARASDDQRRGAGCEGPSNASLQEIIFVNDGSTDTTAEIASNYPVRIINGTGQGPGAARNLGWQASESDLIWFIDSDCVAEPDALEKLLPHISDPDVAGVGGSYSNLFPESLVASLIHEEIVARHRRMSTEVNFLATFNVIYRRDVLQQVGGFNESLKLAQDAELAYRIIAAGHRLRFELNSRVGHHHPRSLRRYLRTQCRQGYFRMMLYRNHPKMISGDSYAGWIDYAQPPLACFSLVALVAALLWSPLGILAVVLSASLFALQWPMTSQCINQMGWAGLSFAFFGFIRAYARAAGMVAGIFAGATARPTPIKESGSATSSHNTDADELPDVTSVSIIIPTRNRTAKLIKCLDALQRQTVHGFEVIVVNDGSSDQTAEALADYSTTELPYSLVAINYAQPRGANPSRNAALRRSKGLWIAMLDDDCFADPDWLRRLVITRNQFDASAITGHVENVALSNPWERFFVGQHRVASTLVDGRPVARRLVAGNALVRRDDLLGRLDEDRASVSTDMTTSGRGDEEGLRLSMIRNGQSILHAENAIVYHDHPYQFRSFCKQAIKSGGSAARLAQKYGLAPRWELLCFQLALATAVIALFFRPALYVAAIAFAIFFAAAIYNETALKRRGILAVFGSLPVLLLYYGLRSIGYVAQLAGGGLLSPQRRRWLGQLGWVRKIHRWREGHRLFGKSPEWQRFQEDWYQSRSSNRSALSDRRPWLTYPAIEWLDDQSLKNAKVFEWGSGGSTLYFLQRDATVTSVEHHMGWADAVEAAVDETDRSRMSLHRHEITDAAEDGGQYVQTINAFPDGHFDLILIDGRQRLACLRAAIGKVRSGGAIVFDNADRVRYGEGLAEMASTKMSQWQQMNFPGPTPYFWDSFAETRVWVREANGDDP